MLADTHQNQASWILERVRDVAPPKANVLDLNSDHTDMWIANAEHVPTDWAVTLTHTCPDNIRLTRLQVLDAGLRNVRFQRADTTRIPFVDNSLDVIITGHMVEESAELDEIQRVLKPDGHLLIVADGVEVRSLRARYETLDLSESDGVVVASISP